MNPIQGDRWPPSQAHGNEQTPQPAHRGLASFGTSNDQQPPPAQAGSSVLPHPTAPLYSAAHSPHTLPTFPSLAQTSPQASQRTPSSSHENLSGPQLHHHPVQSSSGYSLPALNQSVQPPLPSVPIFEREREAREAREREALDKQYREERSARERDRERNQGHMREVDSRRDLEMRDRQLHDQIPPHQNHAGQIHIHQPVAVAPQVRAIHGPNGLLAAGGPMAGPGGLGGGLGAPSGPANIFGGPSQPGNGAPRMPQAAQPGPQSMLLPFGAGPGAQQAQLNMAQGQQPILNDALSYLDQVKVQFVDHPDVYNKFLDIMKDFKGGIIDTPGVIERVSTLFAGNPSLIQGFNTFLPPGYKIECGTGDDRDTIRVTTPMGTTVSSMPVARPLSNPRSGGANVVGNLGDRQYPDSHLNAAATSWSQVPGAGAQDSLVSPDGRPLRQPGFGAPSGQQGNMTNLEAQQREQQAAAANAAALAHHQDQRSVSQLQTALSAAAGGTIPRQGLLSPSGGASSPLPGHATNGNHQQGPQNVGVEKRAPVEFNHAISYVNKIKTRYASQPDIYKQFLEILQTYQRESKPIQEVYSQVTLLFNQAPDLLEDFKQFLPESAAHAKAVAARQAAEDAAMLSNVRGESGYGATPSQAQHTPRADQNRMPPVGSFAPTPNASRDNKRKRGDRQAPMAMTASAVPVTTESNARTNISQGNMNKRVKQVQTPKQAGLPEGQPVSPTLTPAMPEPLPPSSSLTATPEELAFFDKIKKFFNNKSTTTEFLKLCNLFSQDLIDRNMLVHRAQSFIGGNPDLMNWLKKFMRYDGKDEIIENKARPVSGRVSLANCRGLGPSYRLLPKMERMKPCSGRDELCRSVLNDEWASHPTWASEDSGFVAHRKNTHEEGLHRIEEERHDYDSYIEACAKTIQLLQPLAQQLRVMTAEEKEQFRLPPGLGGQSETIYKRVFMRIWGREKGREVIEKFFERPSNALPLVLYRLKEKLEDWKGAQRQWEKVWREQTHKMFWKSLDHQGIGQKLADKRQFQTKTLQNEIQVKYEEQKRQREIQNLPTPKYQFCYSFDDLDVVLDASQLVLAHAEQGHATDYPRLISFIKEFIPIFFGMDPAKFEQRIANSLGSSPPDEEMEDETPVLEGDQSPHSRKGAGKRSGLLRNVLDRGRNGASRAAKEETFLSPSRGSTPEVSSAVDEEVSVGAESPRDAPDGTVEKWLEHPSGGNFFDKRDLMPNEPFRRHTYNMYCNLPIYCFFRMLVVLYERLNNLKQNESEVHDDVSRAKAPKPALDLKMVDKVPQDFFVDTSPTANYYQQVLTMFEEQIRGELDMLHIEETLRRYYLQNGWQLYTFDRLLGALVRFAIALLGNDGKDKSWEIYQLFKKDRSREETTHQDELNYRKQVEKYSKDGDVYKITFDQSTMKAMVRIFKKDDATFDNRWLKPENQWSYYISSFTSVEPTEGIPLSKVHIPLLRRSHFRPDEGSDEADMDIESIKSSENLVIRVCLENYRMLFSPKTDEWMIHGDEARSGGKDGIVEREQSAEKRSDSAQEKMLAFSFDEQDADLEGASGGKRAFEHMIEDDTMEIAPASAAVEQGDQEMADT